MTTHPTPAPRRSTVRIGGASGFWGDTALAVPQLLAGGAVDYLVFDYLAEVTMSILAAQRAKDPTAGYAVDFVQIMMREALPRLQAQGIRVVANAGGVNPLACRDALLKLAAEMGITLKVGVALGDDLVARAGEFRSAGIIEMFSGEPFPQRVASINAYLGALPIARALDAGCDVVITGRCVDSAVTLGVLMHEFGWAADAYDRLAQGTLAGHLIECGAQCTGGLFTDWEQVPDWENIGFPVVEAHADGSFVITKSPGTGGLVTPATVSEQLLYEIGDPRAYLVPDVTCDFTQVRMTPDGADRVRVSGATGRAPTARYKVSATFADGYRNTGFLTIAGVDAVRKARRTGDALLVRMQRMLAAHGLPPFTETRVEVLGGEEMFGAQARQGAREVVLKMSAKGASRDSLELFAREFAPAATSMAPGTLGLVGGRPTPTPVVRLFSFLLDKRALEVSVDIDGTREPVAIPTDGGFDEAALPPALQHASAPQRADAPMVPLIELAHGRSGDKGNKANIGIVARRPEHLAALSAWLTPDRVAAHFAHRAPSGVERFDLPGLHAINFVLHDVLGGGGMASLHTDNLAKAYAQVLLTMEVPRPD
ncbi:acyclic terpene utilization AtuA family protein [Rhizobacter sp. Root404]|uniref:acyclic terpene utilization AtuA family protein n=1 Tax=Rhizobacter sp. Root404 TaxID=1736528 RepID=UPI0006F2616A|nr:acyclic terpene utilization AtuA family protein [Rhizobacter sp. Root404]KQW40015.1 terpene utilization protein AtuA [Rhizobacter sp. Root404]